MLRMRAGETQKPDGPYIEDKEYLGRHLHGEGAGPGRSLEWGRKEAAAVTLPIEVRPFVDEGRDGIGA